MEATDMETTDSRSGLSRRRFLTASAAGAAGMALPGCGTGPPEDRPPLSRPQSVEDEAWAPVRARFILEDGTAYMNNASLGLPPASVAEAVAAGYRALSEEPLRAKNALNDLITSAVVPGLARFLGADPDEVTLTSNASEALHLAAIGSELAPGDEVLITTQEHPSGRRPWELRAARHGLHVKRVFIPSPFQTADEVVALVERALGPRTRAIAFCHVTRGGHLYPVKRLAAVARGRGLLCHVDGAQAVGMLAVDLHDLGCDSYSASLHKWLLGPSGTGFLYVRRGARSRIASAFAADATEASPSYGTPGTAALPNRAGLLPALELVQALGVEAIEARTRYLSDRLKDRLGQTAGVTLLSGPTPETSCSGSTIFEMEDVDALQAVPTVAQRTGIHIDEHQRDGHNAIRVSTHVYNTSAEIDRLIRGLESLRA